MSWEKQFGRLSDEARMREDLYIYKALAEACKELHGLLDVPPDLLRALRDQSKRDPADKFSHKLANEVEREEQLLKRCAKVFTEQGNSKTPKPLTKGMSPTYLKMLQTYRLMQAERER
jgi:hypothetical protein